jgi:glycosyltransferase involved in cell wall biosynthesis
MDRLGLPVDRFQYVPDGVEIESYADLQPNTDGMVVGFLSQMTRGKGLAELVEAFLLLKARPGCDHARLHICGGKTAGDEPYLDGIRTRLQETALGDSVRFFDRFDLEAKRDFLASVTVLSVPTLRPEASALYALESLAAGVPLVLPDHGVNCEVASMTDGVELVRPNDAAALADGLERLLKDRARRDELARAGRAATAEHYNIRVHGDRMMQALNRFLCR